MLKRIGVLILIFSMLTLTGCKVGERTVFISSGNGISNVFTIGTFKCSKKEFNLYMACFKDYYGNLGTADSNENKGKDNKDKDKKENDPPSVEDLANNSIKYSALGLLTRVYSLNLYAKQNDIKLSGDEENDIQMASDNFYDSLSKEAIQTLDISEKDIRDAYEKYALALKVYTSLMEGVDGEVTEDEARVMQGYVLHLEDAGKANEVAARIQAGDDFATLTQAYSKGSKKLITFGRDMFPREVDKAAFSLEEDEVTDRIDTDEGVYFVKCVTKYDQEKSEKNKETIIDRRQKALLRQIETEQSENNYSSINMDYVENASPKSVDLSANKGFFRNLEEYLSF